MGLPHSTYRDQHPTYHPGPQYIADHGALENSSCALPVREEVCTSRVSECLLMASTSIPLASILVAIDCGRISRSHPGQPGHERPSRLLRILFASQHDGGGKQLLAFSSTSPEHIEKEGYMHTPPSPPVQATPARFSDTLTRLLQSLSAAALFSLQLSLQFSLELDKYERSGMSCSLVLFNV